MALVLVLMLAIYGVQSASLPLSTPSDSSEGRLDASTDPPDVSDSSLDTLAARLDVPDTLDAPSQEASVRQADSSSSEDARSDGRTPPQTAEKLAELRTPLASDLSNPLDTLASKLAVLPNPIGALDSIVGTLGSEKVRRSVLEDVKQLIETKFSALLEDGVKRIAGKKGILKQGLKLKPTSPLVLRVQEKDRESSEEEEASNSGMIKVLTDGPLQDSVDMQLRTVVDELLKEDEDKTEDKEIINSKEDRLSIENLSRSQKEAETIEDYDDINSESYRKFDNDVKENSSETNKNKEKTEEPENILDLDEILKTALVDSSDSLSQENVEDEDQNLTAESLLSRLLETKNDKSDEIFSEIEYKPQKTADTEEHVESNVRNGIDIVKNDNDDIQAYGASNIDIDENELQTEVIHPYQNVDEENNAMNLLKQGQNIGNLIHMHENKTVSDLRNHNEYISSETIRPSQNDELSDAYQLLNIKQNDKSDGLKQIHEKNDLNKITEANTYAQLVQSIARSEDQNEDKHIQQQATQHQSKIHHHHHGHHHHHHHSRHSNSEDLPILKTGAAHEKTALAELKNYNTEEKQNHLKSEIDEEKNIPLEKQKAVNEENSIKTENNDIVKERKSAPEEDKNIHGESDAEEKTSGNEKGLESETSEARTAPKNTQTIGGQSKKLGEEENNSKELLDEVDGNKNGNDKKIYLADDNDYLIGKRRKGSDNKGKLAEEHINIARNDYVTTHHKYGCHDKTHRERKGKSDDNDETNILQNLMYNANKIKSYSLSMTFSTNQ